VPIIACPVCGEKFERRTNSNKYCSSSCKDKGKPSKRKNRCSVCGKAMQGNLNPKSVCNPCRGVEPYGYKRTHARNGFVSHGSISMYHYGCRCDDCREAMSEYMRAYARRVKAKHGVGPASLSRRKFKERHGYWPQARYGYDIPHRVRRAVYERDGWVCQICGGLISRDYDPYDRLAPSLDHIVPQSSVLLPDHSEANLRMVHTVCNTIRGNGVFSDDEVRVRSARFVS
jgi:5-methylcytosine-specific restriction endonuclease McrA